MTNESEHTEINVHLAKIETKLDIVLDEHDRRLDKIETTQGKQSAIYIAMSAIGVSIGFAIKYIVMGGKA